MNAFSFRLSERISEHGSLCVGLDPAAPSLAACGLPDSGEGAFEFSQRVLNASEGRLSVVKPQSAYFERYGSAGYMALEKVISLAHEMGLLVILDAKRGDIDTTAEAYAHAFFNPESSCCVDALTVHPYLGFEALRKFLDYSTANGGGVFAMVRSSNPEGQALQKAMLPSGLSVAEDMCRLITEYNREVTAGEMGPVGAVVGATCDDADAMAEQLPLSYMLAPGIGAQGAKISDLVTRFPNAYGRMLPSVSRGILANGTTEAEIRSAIQALRQEALQLRS